MNNIYQHRPVLLTEAMEALAIHPEGYYIDGTFGRGGHSEQILQSLGPQGRLLAFDKDPAALEHAAGSIKDERFFFHRGSFCDLEKQVHSMGWSNKVDGILLDLGVSSPQLEDASRGFSFMKKGPLDMRMDPTKGESAAEWLTHVPEKTLANIIYDLGEERFSRRIAHRICKARAEAPLTTTEALADVVASAIPRREKHKHPATRTFQALRIFLNNELDELHQVLEQSLHVLKNKGRLVVITFHSLEDRMVKQFMQRCSGRRSDVPANLPILPSAIQSTLRIIGKVIKPTLEELDDNPRARSAKLRVGERVTPMSDEGIDTIAY